jgi:hypothetical protein
MAVEDWQRKSYQDWIDRHKLVERFSDVEDIEVTPLNCSPGSVEIRLHSKGTIADSTASAVTKAIRDAVENLWVSRGFVRGLKELADSPEQIELVRELYYSQQDEKYASYPVPHFDIGFGELERITPLAARALAECNSGRDRLLSLSSLKKIPDDVAKEFEAFCFETLDLSGLEELTPFAAEKLCSAEVDEIILDGLKSLSLETAIAIAEHSKGAEISMLGVVGLSQEVVIALNSKGIRPYLSGQALEDYLAAT